MPPSSIMKVWRVRHRTAVVFVDADDLVEAFGRGVEDHGKIDRHKLVVEPDAFVVHQDLVAEKLAHRIDLLRVDRRGDHDLKIGDAVRSRRPYPGMHTLDRRIEAPTADEWLRNGQRNRDSGRAKCRSRSDTADGASSKPHSGGLQVVEHSNATVALGPTSTRLLHGNLHESLVRVGHHRLRSLLRYREPIVTRGFRA